MRHPTPDKKELDDDEEEKDKDKEKRSVRRNGSISGSVCSLFRFLFEFRSGAAG